MKNTDIRRSQRLRVLQIRKIIEAAVNLEVKCKINQFSIQFIYNNLIQAVQAILTNFGPVFH